jgi:DnaJ-class molecular chaperone
MPRVHSHYENLKVSRDAPPEVIRAAYKALSQRYHPDRQQPGTDTTRVMQLINVAFDTLSDPETRKEHDDWIRATEAADASQATREEPSPESPGSGFGDQVNGQSKAVEPPDLMERHRPFEFTPVYRHLKKYWGWYMSGLIGWVIFYGNLPRR